MSIRQAAVTIGLSESAAYHTSQTPEFRKRVSELRTEAIAGAVGRLSSAATLAVDTLVELLDEKNDAKDRLNASKAILAALVPLSEFGELRARIEKLEASQGLKVAS
ncbi:hypothetical protein SH467x_001238 [Pirellulaceae bacterium SH467]